jgi:hypothetical protein
MNDKDKSVIGKLVDTVTNAVGGAVKAAVMPTNDPEEEVMVEKTNEQLLVGDAAIAPEAVLAPIAPKITAKRSRTRPTPKAKVASPAAKASAKKSKKSAPKKSAKSRLKAEKVTKTTVKKMKKAKKTRKKSKR